MTSSTHGGRGCLPYAYTEQGVAMLSAVLRSKTAVKVSIINAFLEMRKLILIIQHYSRDSTRLNLNKYKLTSLSEYLVHWKRRQKTLRCIYFFCQPD